jgi:hypothetical protein
VESEMSDRIEPVPVRTVMQRIHLN